MNSNAKVLAFGIIFTIITLTYALIYIPYHLYYKIKIPKTENHITQIEIPKIKTPKRGDLLYLKYRLLKYHKFEMVLINTEVTELGETNYTCMYFDGKCTLQIITLPSDLFLLKK